MLWTYMGPPEHTAAAAGMGVRHGAGRAALRLQAAAGMQLAAGDGRRHRFEPRLVPAPRQHQHRPAVQGRRRATNTISATRGRCSRWSKAPGGLYIGARRNAENGNYYWRITQWVMPSFTMIPPRGGHPVHGHFWIPIDDENCWAWSYDYHPTRALTDRRARGDGGRQGHPRANTCRAPSARSPTRTTII